MAIDVLAIGAHPDDVELACGGTIALLTKQGHHVGIVDCTRGELGTRGTAQIREAESKEAARILGADFRENLGLPDGNIENTPENRLRIISVIREHRPRILLMPHWLERHPDHEHAHRLAKEAWFYSGLEKIVSVGTDRSPHRPYRPPKYFYFMERYEFTPSFIVDISEVIETRMEAVRAFKSQFFDPSSRESETLMSRADFFEWMLARLRHFGRIIGRQYGEPFYSIEPIGLTDMFGITLREQG
ncbi:MAG: bacillithiol biosynthesis deacetylase BshB1 [Ignavibacteriales bacterium CG07_land_8_20_14_0_80_59_12]|nr:MAG: bacillithiol biosynthesis deacetylase BshB1 [Ignavibacteriales bacterium CG07_land_8_20_14_0_80_59_12]